MRMGMTMKQKNDLPTLPIEGTDGALAAGGIDPLLLAGCPAEDCLERLVRALRAAGRLSAEGAAGLGRALGVLLEARALRYLAGESRSMRVEVRDGLLHSMLYTIGIALKAGPAPDEVLLQNSLQALYEQGHSLLAKQVATAKRLWRAVQSTRLPTPAVCYNDAITKGMGAFFHFYDIDYAATETPADIDYFLALPLEDTCGIEYITEWLRRVLIENRFCGRFAPEAVHRMLLRREADYAGLPLNLCEPVLLCATGALMAGCDPLALAPTADALVPLADRFAEGAATAGRLLKAAADKLCAVLGFAPEDGLTAYARQVAGQNGSVLQAAAAAGQLAAFFTAKGDAPASWTLM